MMIWFILGMIVLAGFLYLAHPLYSAQFLDAQKDTEIGDYQERIEALDAQIKQGGEISAQELEKIALQRQIINSASKAKSEENAASKPLLAGLLGVLLVGGFGLYNHLGSPKLTTLDALQTPTQSTVNADNFPEVVARLGAQLKKEPDNAAGWLTYARSLMRLERYKDALKAYENLLALLDNDPKIFEEYESAKAYIQTQIRPEITDEAILNMVNGLSEKLKNDPRNSDGWIRLIRSRQVLGDTEKLANEIARMRTAFKDNPDEIKRILSESGYQR